jgi:hypothetical protein
MNDDRTNAGHAKTARSANANRRANPYEQGIMGVWSRAGQNYLYSMAALNEAAMQIANEQMSASAEAARTLGQCHDLNEAMQVHSKLMQSSGEACVRGWARWVDASNELLSGTLGDTAKPL